MSIQDVFFSIESQTKDVAKNKVYVLEIESIPFKKITPDLQNLLESFTSLQFLTINNCSLDSLENFPYLPGLIRLDLVSNSLSEGFQTLNRSKYLQFLFLGGNQITDLKVFVSLSLLPNLLQLDLTGNPVTAFSGYFRSVFDDIPSLKVLDGKDKQGLPTQDGVETSESIKRIRPDLFIKGASLQNLPQGGTQKEEKQESDDKPKKKKEEKKEVKAIKRTNSYKNNVVADKGAKFISQRVGLIFPVGRVRRYLRQKMEISKLREEAAIFTTAVLEYMCAEILEAAGNKAKEKGLKNIKPTHLMRGIKYDLELKEFYEKAIIPEAEFVSKLRIE